MEHFPIKIFLFQLTFNFSKLPDPDGSGRLYSVSARAVASVVPSGAEVVSREEEVRVATMPLKPRYLLCSCCYCCCCCSFCCSCLVFFVVHDDNNDDNVVVAAAATTANG